MKPYLALFALTALLILPAQPPFAAATTPMYRVEVVVFMYPNGTSDRRLSSEPADYSALPDTRANARAAAFQPSDAGLEDSTLSDEEQQDQAREEAISIFSALDALEQGIQASTGSYTGGPVYPQPWVNLEAPGPEMADAWRRLDESPHHRPLTWRAWYQPIGSGQTAQWLRLHDERIIDLNWLEPESLSPDFVPDDKPVPYRLPSAQFRLDGGIRLRERQFMHADIDIVWQEPVAGPPNSLAGILAEITGFEQHRLNQSRSIRLGRLEYFDSPWLGVLLKVERWQSPWLEVKPQAIAQ